MSRILERAGLFGLAGLLFALAGCFSPRPHPGHIPGEPAAVEPIVVEASAEPYKIRAGDELEIRFFHTPEQNLVLPVRPDGFISLPLVYELRAAGRTAEDLRRDLVERYSRELAEPEIAVIVRTFHTAYSVHVGGEVEKPGVLLLDEPRTVLEAVLAAGGFLPGADLADVIVVRKQQDGGYEIEGSDLTKVLNGEDARGNFTLRPFDVVYVPSSRIADVNKWVDQYIRKNLPITFTYRLDNNGKNN